MHTTGSYHQWEYLPLFTVRNTHYLDGVTTIIWWIKIDYSFIYISALIRHSIADEVLAARVTPIKSARHHMPLHHRRSAHCPLRAAYWGWMVVDAFEIESPMSDEWRRDGLTTSRVHGAPSLFLLLLLPPCQPPPWCLRSTTTVRGVITEFKYPIIFADFS